MVFFFVFFFGQIGGTVAQSVDGDVYFGWLKSLAWRRVAFCGFIHIYILYRFCQIYCGNTHKHGRAWYNRFLWVIGYRDQSRNVEEEWRCIFVFVIIDIDRYNRCKIYSSIYSLVLFYMVYMGRSRAPSLIYRYIYISVPVPDRIGYSVFRAEQIRRVQSQSINQSVASHWKWHRIVYSYRFLFWLLLCFILRFMQFVRCVAFIFTNSLFCVLFFCLLFVRFLLQGAARFDKSLRI